MWYVYILLCDQKTYYVGLTSNIDNRLRSHKSKENIATKEFSGLELVYIEKYKTRRATEKRERQIKGWSKAKKKALIEGDVELLKKLSKS
ncbi:hypothetical protein A3A76_00575 [Candidatus Woesebacteria bacterium RIFCSPLOWO2_01_FULL_39_23]|uniref:GIY-YIG domain-containing protein n=1 Tax=Candidatus Woesebacteria bacterium RIFCSPHIGHO2_01_FULL_40_22 TaxID=1802499 RepID=A0A1F7YIK6_9BACT|nr:MAG: hypothetical protein A2141_05810 [Candidatus Woesebacteria bacterium RBG_16_40_11]OGM27191.1 MAG: hypothetical protein A2628_04090 [Candidatus Woesebacteria bacterium RIFCSPHIGHO2_01_FULL_40_22]OGM36927.1 MAG: hypothetical protein A3E41_05140 [Candidatus Woesebacteria bacterium RIFCSPHIGHO2_12_FULL_38_9]OGM63357.1 MAG: hypothetical protein A3A76_00575 [Candidatus Woesebacteria bacterium RIFCSPLOWO2_01_FULL_39_23]